MRTNMPWAIAGGFVGFLLTIYAEDIARTLGAPPKIQKGAKKIFILFLLTILVVDILI